MKRTLITVLVLSVLGAVVWRLAGWGGAARAGRASAAGARAVEDFAHGWNTMVATYVHEGIVDYRHWHAREPELDKLLKRLEEISPADLGTGHAPLAFWIDAYNARVVREVLHGQSAATAYGRTRLFLFTRFRLAGRSWSLDSLEKMLRAQGDPRVHFALNCASRSCPRLRAESYYLAAARLDAVLSDQGRQFLRDSSRNRFDVADREAHLSEIFKWYRGDFEQGGESLQLRIAPYAEPRVAAVLKQNGFKLGYLPYDWNLNGNR